MQPSEVTEEMLLAFDAAMSLHETVADAIAAAITQWQRENADKFRVFCDSTESIAAVMKAEADAQACPHCGGSGIAAWNVFKPAEE